MKKNIIFAAAFCFSILSCSKVGLTPDTQTLPTERTETDGTPVVKKWGPTASAATASGAAESITAKPSGDGIAIDPVAKCYTITNTEKGAGFAEYKFSYVGGKGAVQTVSLPFGQSISFSSTSATVKANFAYLLIEGGGNCGPR